MSSMFDLLMELPLFRGVSHDTMKNIVGMAKFHFLKYPEGAVVVKENSPCTHITFVISGSVRLTTTNNNGRISVSQTLRAPDVIFPRREHHARRAERLHPVIPHPCKSIDKGRTLHTPYGTKIT